MKVFISYAEEDFEEAKKIYDALKKNGINAWMRNDLPVGQHIDIIKKEIRKSDFFIALISFNSVSKKGYFQKELKTATEILDELPEDEIFVIPVRIEDCKPTNERLVYLNYADMFPDWEEGFKKIIKTIDSKKKIIQIKKPHKGKSDKSLYQRIFVYFLLVTICSMLFLSLTDIIVSKYFNPIILILVLFLILFSIILSKILSERKNNNIKKLLDKKKDIRFSYISDSKNNVKFKTVRTIQLKEVYLKFVPYMLNENISEKQIDKLIKDILLEQCGNLNPIEIFPDESDVKNILAILKSIEVIRESKQQSQLAGEICYYGITERGRNVWQMFIN